MATIDVKFMKGNKQTLKSMSTTYKSAPPKKEASKSAKKAK